MGWQGSIECPKEGDKRKEEVESDIGNKRKERKKKGPGDATASVIRGGIEKDETEDRMVCESSEKDAKILIENTEMDFGEVKEVLCTMEEGGRNMSCHSHEIRWKLNDDVGSASNEKGG